MKTYTTLERIYDDMLGVLPPAAMERGANGVSGFLVGEPTDHDEQGEPRYASYFTADNQYFAGENMTITEFKKAVNLTEQELRDNEETPEAIEKELELRKDHGDGLVNAYISLFSEKDLDELEDRYYGTFESDEAFARAMADDLGDIKEGMQWPYTCIDWEQAARELMYDYCDEDGYYFRNS